MLSALLVLLPALAACSKPAPSDWIDDAQRSSAWGASAAQVDMVLTQNVGQGTFGKVWLQAFSVVAVAELFDKTWFVALLYSTRCGAQVSFLASFFALSVHTFLAAGMGAAVSRVFPVWSLHFTTAAVFAGLALAYAVEYYRADGNTDALKTRAQEAQEAMADEPEAQYLFQTPLKRRNFVPMRWQDFWKVFFAVFFAEWGDRTQIAMLSLHSSLAIAPVVLGSLAAFAVLSFSAAILATMLKGKRLSEKFICGVSALSFAVFSLLALHGGVQALRMERDSLALAATATSEGGYAAHHAHHAHRLRHY